MPTSERMVTRQKMLADFGDLALRSDDLDEVLHEACRLVAEALRADLAKILEIEDDGRCLLVRAGVGWKEGIVGSKRLDMGEDTSESFSIRKGRPVISQNIREEKRFRFADLLIEHGAMAIVNAPIFLPGGKIYGLLQVDSREPRAFGDEEVEFLRTYTTVLGPVIDRLHKINSLQEALEVNQRLLRELQHRVKNHIGIIAALVMQRAKQTASDEVREELTAVGERIDTLRRLHQDLYSAGAAERLALRPFVVGLVENLRTLHEEQSGPVRLEIRMGEIEVVPDVAVPLGLILNEFVTNSLRYAFEGNGGTIGIRLEDAEEGLCLSISDDGRGLPAEPNLSRRGSGTGLKLIEGLAQQLGTEAVWLRPEQGTALRLQFRAGSGEGGTG